MHFKSFIVLVASMALLSGCAARTASLSECAVMGATVVGAAGGAGADSANSDWAGAGVAIGAVTGAALGWVICSAIPEAVEPEPVVVAAEPAPPPPPAPKARVVLRGVNFSFDSADLDAGSQAIIAVAAEILNENPGVRVRVEGYTDSTGPAAYNMGLSHRRAESVSRALIAGGVAASRLDIEAFGATDPLASNATAEGRRLNRRVQLVVIDPP
ncbi:OmpA family protein [Myxococcota bacterium]|nr:OmpA family protein [Myxococcota bacterium]